MVELTREQIEELRGLLDRLVARADGMSTSYHWSAVSTMREVERKFRPLLDTAASALASEPKAGASEELCKRLADDASIYEEAGYKPGECPAMDNQRDAIFLIRRLERELYTIFDYLEPHWRGAGFKPTAEWSVKEITGRYQEKEREATTAEALVAELREKAAAIAKDLADRGYSGDAIAAAIRSGT